MLVGVWRFTCRKMVSLPCILPRKHCCKQVAATNFQPPRDRRHLSYCHCENLEGMPSTEFLAHVHHSGANIALWPRSPPSLQWQVQWVNVRILSHKIWHSLALGNCAQALRIRKYKTIQKTNWQWWDPGIKYDQVWLNPSQTPLHHHPL